MKKLLLLTLLITGLTINAQTTLGTISLTENSNFTSTGVELFGNNCGILGGVIIVEDLNLNGFTLYLKQGNELTINGNLNGPGEIRLCNGKDTPGLFSVCVNGSIQNDHQNTLSSFFCNNLSNPVFNIQSDFGYEYEIYNTNSQLIKSGYTDQYIYESLPKNQLFFIKVKGFSPDKFIIQE